MLNTLEYVLKICGLIVSNFHYNEGAILGCPSSAGSLPTTLTPGWVSRVGFVDLAHMVSEGYWLVIYKMGEQKTYVVASY